MSQRVAVVTGGSRGIGRAISLALGERDIAVAVNYATRADAAAEVVADIEAAGGRASAFGADVSSEKEVTAMFGRVSENLGPVTILVNNAGITRDNLLLRMSVDDFDEVISTNLRSAFLCTKAAMRTMLKAKWGRVVSLASVSGISGNAGQANYAASKAGIIGFSKSVAKEVGARGITVNIVAPGFISTDMTDALDDGAKSGALDAITLGRFGAAEEIAATVAFLTGDDAAYITGQVISVDGGITL